MYKAILFDLDGTLTDSGEGITKSVQYALEKVGKPEPDLQKLRIFVGPPLLEQFQEYAGIDEETARKAVGIYRERYAPVGIYENELYPGIPEMLSGLKQRGYKLAIASSKPENFVKIVAEYFHIDSYFDEMVGSEPEGRRTNKTEVIEETLKRLGFSEHRDQVIMVGDKEHDVFGARRAGLECIAVSYGYGTEEELKNAHPFKIVNSAEEILDFFRLSPRRKQKMPVLAWKCLYPVGIHFVLSQLVSYLGLYFLVQRTGADMSAYYQHVLMLTGLTGILAAVPCILLYRGDFSRRKETGILYPAADRHLPVPEILGFLIIGAFLGQYGNILVGLFQQYLNPEAYQETQSLISEGKSIWSLIFWMGIAAPFAEEVIFRWLVFLRMRDNMRVITAALFSGLTFGIYHMNLLQGVYATIMGLLFALILEWRGNLFASVFLHMGANIWSLLVSDVMLYMLDHTGATSVIALNLFLVFAGTYGIWRCYKNYQKRGCTRLI